VKRLLLDQGLPRSTRTFLARAEWDVIHVGEVGLSRATDQSILDYARENDRICVTLDADFHALLATADAAKPSVVRIRKEP
jgi:predicted nuclease of predicted toxin-antitoxin system